jgi:hypothetical protein
VVVMTEGDAAFAGEEEGRRASTVSCRVYQSAIGHRVNKKVVGR